jgi:predicted ATP-dependent protease
MPEVVKINEVDLKKSIVGGSEANLLAEKKFLEKESENAIKIEEVTTRREYNLLLQQNREEKKKYARLIFILTCCWGTLIFIIVLANGLTGINGQKYFEFSLSDTIIITLITSTTVNFFGFFLLVVKYLFNTRDISAREGKQ